MASLFNIKITWLRIYSMFLVFLSLQVFSVTGSSDRELSPSDIQLLERLKALMTFYTKELDWELLDAREGIIHWGINDFSDDLIVRRNEIQYTYPQCAKSVDIAHNQIMSNSSLINNCFSDIYKTLEKCQEFALQVLRLRDLDELIDNLASYADTKRNRIIGCYKPSYLFAYNTHRETIDLIDTCVKENSPAEILGNV